MVAERYPYQWSYCSTHYRSAFIFHVSPLSSYYVLTVIDLSIYFYLWRLVHVFYAEEPNSDTLTLTLPSAHVQYTAHAHAQAVYRTYVLYAVFAWSNSNYDMASQEPPSSSTSPCSRPKQRHCLSERARAAKRQNFLARVDILPPCVSKVSKNLGSTTKMQNLMVYTVT